MSVEGYSWRTFLRRHRTVVAAFAVACALALAWAVYVFLWFVGNAQSTGLVPPGLGAWTMGNLLNFIVYAVFWELLLVGIPVVIVGVAAWQWWKRLPGDEMMGRRFGRSRGARGGGGASLFFLIAFAIKVYIDGNWNVPISTFTLDYVVGSMFTILVWVLVIFGIPAAIALVWWLSREMKKP